MRVSSSLPNRRMLQLRLALPLFFATFVLLLLAAILTPYGTRPTAAQIEFVTLTPTQAPPIVSVTPTPPDSRMCSPERQYRAEYYNNVDEGDAPALVQCEDWPIDHDWNTGSPGARIDPDHFSARWIGRAHIAEGDYIFSYRSDDGMRAYLDGELIIDNWNNPSLQEGSVARHVQEGMHDIRVEYYENAGSAVARFRWDRQSELSVVAPTDISIDAPNTCRAGETFNLSAGITPSDATLPLSVTSFIDQQKVHEYEINDNYWSESGLPCTGTPGDKLNVAIWAGNRAGGASRRVEVVVVGNHPPIPGGGRIIFTSSEQGNFEIYRLNEDGTGLINLTGNPATDNFPTWSPDGTQIAFTSNRDGRLDIYTMDANGANVTRRTVGGHNITPAWSPDGSRIAFASNREGDWDIYVMDARGSDVLTRLTDDPHNDVYPTWSPDGSQIAFTSDRDGDPDIFVMNADGNQPTNLTHRPGADYDPDWAPTGDRIAFSSEGAGDQITRGSYIMNQDGSDLRFLSAGIEPAWAADGVRLVVGQKIGDIHGLVVTGLNHQPQILLTQMPDDVYHPDWSASGAPNRYCTPEQYYAEYYNNPTLSGAPTWVECAAEPLRYHWTADRPAPAPGVSLLSFSARWTRHERIAPGTYIFSVHSEDGMRVYLDDQLVIDNWQPSTRDRLLDEITLTEDRDYTITVEFYQTGGDATAFFDWGKKVEVTGRVFVHHADSMVEPVAGVDILGALESIKTDANGFYTARFMEPGPHTITPVKSGYHFDPRSISFADPAERNDWDFTATEEAGIPPPRQDVRISHVWLADQDGRDGLPRLKEPNRFSQCFTQHLWIELRNNGDAQFDGGRYQLRWELRDDQGVPDSQDILTEELQPLPSVPAHSFSQRIHLGELVATKSVEHGSLRLVLTDPYGKLPPIAELTVPDVTVEVNPLSLITCTPERLITRPHRRIRRIQLAVDQLVARIEALKKQLSGDATAWVGVHSPAYPLVINSAGQRTGFLSDGRIVEEIPGSRVLLLGGQKLILYPHADDIRVELVGYATGDMTIQVGFADAEGTGIMFAFEHVHVSPSLHALLDSSDHIGLLQVDADGNGIIDQLVAPDSAEQTLSSASPTLTVPVQQHVHQYSDPLAFSVSAVDTDSLSSTLVFSATNLPAGLALTNNRDGTAVISGTVVAPAGVYATQITVADAGGLTDTKPVTITISPEDVQFAYTGDSTPGAGSFTLRTNVVEPADGFPGDRSKAVVFFDLTARSSGATTSYGPAAVTASGEASWTVSDSLPSDTYIVSMRIDSANGYYQTAR